MRKSLIPFIFRHTAALKRRNTPMTLKNLDFIEMRVIKNCTHRYPSLVSLYVRCRINFLHKRHKPQNEQCSKNY